ncbi:MAG: SpoIVB peptidase [Roseburia sp.]
MKHYYQFVKQITWLGFVLVAAFATRTFYDAIPERIYISQGEEIAYRFEVPVSISLKESSAEVFENFSSGGPADGLTYTVTCKLLGILPVKDVEVMLVDGKEIYASGMPIGIYARTDGVLVVGTGAVTDISGKEYRPAEHLVKSGDYIVSVNGEAVTGKEELIEKIDCYGANKEIIGIRRNHELIEVALNPIKSSQGNYMLGIWVRDDLAGVGTLTYCDKNGEFGALGHAVSDGDTGTLMEMSEGWIYMANIVGIQKGRGGDPGKLSGVIHYSKEECLGSITKNTSLGIHGRLDGNVGKVYRDGLYQITYKQDIRKGTAYIISSVSGESERYEIQIEEIDYSGKENNKGILFRVTDQRLLEHTGGIVQGMSGSPVIQDGKIIGAVTHVFVNDPSKGYGVFIENMLE